MRRHGFTLVELLVVMAIIGILVSLILIAAQQSDKEARIAATQGLISKLDAAMKDRVAAAMATHFDAQQSHMQMAWPYFQGVGSPAYGSSYLMSQILPRAQVISDFDHYRWEFPDTWFVQNQTGPYPINFAMLPFPNQYGAPTPSEYVQPLGSYRPQGTFGATDGGYKGEGVFGAHYGAASALYKNIGAKLGNTPISQTGIDLADNDSNGLIDDLPEWGPNTTAIFQDLANHKHVTARSEMLYAILVEWNAPYSPPVDPSEFASTEIGDTDGDGLPEFLDAWGKPLQFFRWPILYHSDLQRGLYAQGPPSGCTGGPGPFLNAFDPREQDPLDPNQTLMAPSWWSSSANFGITGQSGQGPLSGGTFIGAVAFQNYFHLLIEPLTAGGGGASPCAYWDRGASTYQRRAFFSRPLIMSAGPDGVYGVPILSDTQIASAMVGGPDAVSVRLNIEGQAAQVDIVQRTNAIDSTWNGPYTNGVNPDSGNLYVEDGSDDITNQSSGSLESQTP